jgi:hypothetical protein
MTKLKKEHGIDSMFFLLIDERLDERPWDAAWSLAKGRSPFETPFF